MEFTRILGIDPGVTGAYTLLSIDGKIIETHNFPLLEDIVPNYRGFSGSDTRVDRYYNLVILADIFNYFSRMGGVVAYVEKVYSYKKEAAANAFKFGQCYGELRGMLIAHGIPMILVPPATWCKAVHISQDRKVKAKIRSRQTFEHLFTSYKHKGRGKTPDGIVDATLIAEYGRRRMRHKLDDWKIKDQFRTQ